MAKFLFFKRKSKTPFLKMYDKVVKWMEKGEILTPQLNRYTKASVYNYKTRRINLEKFINERGGLNLEDIDVEVGEEFIMFLNSLNLCKNTIGTAVGGFKAILNILYRKKLSHYNGTGIRTAKELTTAVFSSIEDIQTLLNTDLSDTPGLALTRDVYVMHCFLGLRFTDLRKILRDPRTYMRTHGNKVFFELKTHKTGEVVVIPISSIVKHFLTAYNYDFGKLFTYQHYNRCIKDFAARAALTEKIECTRTRGGLREDYYMRKCDMMSSHTARRTFATNATLSKDFKMQAIMKITGHKSVSSFERYVRCSVLEMAISVANNDFFSIPFAVDGKVIEKHNEISVNLPAVIS